MDAYLAKLRRMRRKVAKMGPAQLLKVLPQEMALEVVRQRVWMTRMAMVRMHAWERSGGGGGHGHSHGGGDGGDHGHAHGGGGGGGGGASSGGGGGDDHHGHSHAGGGDHGHAH